MKKPSTKELEALLERSVDVEIASRVIGELAKNAVFSATDFSKLILAVAIVEKSSSTASSFRQIEKQLLPLSVIPKLKETPELLLAYSSWLRFRSLCKWGTFSSLVFAICGIYLCFVDYLPIELGGPLIILFALLSVVFLRNCYNW